MVTYKLYLPLRIIRYEKIYSDTLITLMFTIKVALHAIKLMRSVT